MLSFGRQRSHFCVYRRYSTTVKTYNIRPWILYNRFFVCNTFLLPVRYLYWFNYEPISSGGLRPPQHQVEYKSSLLTIVFVSLIAECVSKLNYTGWKPYKHIGGRVKTPSKALIINAFALTIIFADEKKEEKNSFILYTFVKFALVTEQKLNIEEYSISSVNPVPFLA